MTKGTKKKSKSIVSWPADERPRERLIAQGPHALTDAELVAIEGQLMTCYRTSQDLNDCGLRFEELDGDMFCCRVCKTGLKAVIL